MEAVDAVEQGDYFHALDIIYDAECSGSEFEKHYKVSGGTLWEALSADYYRRISLPDCAA